MPRKSRRIYDPTLAPVDTMDTIHTMEDDNLGIGYDQEDPLALNDDMEYDDDERQVTEIVDPKLHGLPLPRSRYKRRFTWCLVTVGFLVIIITMSVLVSKKNKKTTSSAAYLPAPPSDLSTLCSQTTIQSQPDGLLKCEQACQPAECCNYPAALDLSCLTNHQDECLQYHKYCGILLAPDSTHTSNKHIPSPPSNLDQLCALDKLNTGEGIQLCAQICVPQHCCYEPGSDSCRLNPNCEGYAPCLNLAAHDNTNNNIALEVRKKCSSSDTADLCREVCQVARCCFAGDSSCQFKQEPAAFCNQYLPCGSLSWSTPLPDDDNVPTMFPTFEPTSHTPEPTIFPTAGPTPATYQPTVSYMPTPVGGVLLNANYLPPLPANLTNICSSFTSNTDDAYNECDDMCIAAECCDFPEKFPQSCLGTQTALCLEYSMACAPLDQNGTKDTITLDIKTSNLAGDSLGQVCSAESISYTIGLKECRKRCQPAKCCWHKTGPRCDDPRCTVYAPCLNLVAMNQVSTDIIETVQTACTSSMIASVEGRAICESVCLQHSCCYDDTCVVEDQTVCDQYQGCKALYEAGTSFTVPINIGHAVLLPPPSNLQDLCDETLMDDDGFYNDCAAACSAADCCNYPANMDISCLKGNENTCFTYHKECAALRAFVTPQVQVTLAAAPSNLTTLCLPTSLATDFGRSQCETFCNVGECCWKDDMIASNSSCRDNINCPGYAPCLNLQAGANNSTQVTTVIDQSCTIRQFMQPGGRQACDSVCRQFSCCYTPGSNSCFRNSTCRQYDGCELLVDMDQNGIPDVTQVSDPATLPPTAAPI